MSRSWFNISGNLSSIASNVTNFTKEVLHDAATESYEDFHTESEFQQGASNAVAYETPDELLRKISYLQTELHKLNDADAYKNEQISHLQNENKETIRQYENHFENLKQNLLEKEKEIELFAQRLQENDTLYRENINRLHERNLSLEAKLAEETNTSINSMDNGWTDDWGVGNTGQDMNDLAFKNECLANDLAMKEIIINAIESKMFQISNNNVEASNFSEWIDGILNEKMTSEDKFKQISYILDEKINVENQWKEMCSVLGKNIDEQISPSGDDYVQHVDEWLSAKLSKYIELENENNEHRDIISNIECRISKFGEGYDDFKITNFTEWCDSLGSGENYIFYNDSSKSMLEQIEHEIRDFDDDDGDFQIENFSSWLEKVQCRIDDLEVEVINEQETRDTEEKQRVSERETLQDLFNQKQSEISLLKVELYNKTSHTLNPIVEVEQEDLMTVHEQLNETTARCEALQLELGTSQKQAMETKDMQQRFTVLSAEYDLIKEQLLNAESANEKTVVELTDIKEKYNVLCAEHNELITNNSSMKQDMVSLGSIQTQLHELKTKYDSVCAEFDQVSKEHNELTARCELLQNAETVSNDLQLQVNNLSAINDCIKEQLVTSESSKESIQMELNGYRIKYDSISTEVDRLTGDLKEATSRYELLQAAETVSDSLQLQLNNLSADKDSLKEQLAVTESSKETMLAELNELKADKDLLKEQLAVSESSNETMLAELNKLKADKDCLKEQLVVSESSKQTVLAELNELEAKYKSKCIGYDELSATCKEMTENLEILQNEASTLVGLQVHLREESARSDNIKEMLLKSKEGIENELAEYKTKYNHLHEEVDRLSKVNDDLVESNALSKNIENELQTEYHLLKLVQLQSEEDKGKLRKEVEYLRETNNELSSANQQVAADIVNVNADLNLMVMLLSYLMNGGPQPCDMDVSLTNEKSMMIFGSIKDLAEKYTTLQNQCNELTDVADEYKTKLCEKESKMADQEDVHTILVYVIKSIDNILPESKKGNIVSDNTLSSTEMSSYVSYLKTLEEFIEKIKTDYLESLESNNLLKQDAEEMTSFLEMEKGAREECKSQIDRLTATIGDYNNTIEQLQAQLSKQTDVGDLEISLQRERDANEQLRGEIDKLNNTAVDYKETIEQLKAGSSKPAVGGGSDGSGGMKFGAIKRKLQDLENCNQALLKENEQLKNIGGTPAIPNTSEVADEIKRMRCLLNDKNEECECYEEECKMLKASLMEMQEQSIVLKSAHSEIHLLKEKLIEYENMLQSASTASDEATVASRHHQEQLHNLSLMLMEKNEETERYQEENEYLKSKLLEVENEISDMELIREECKQLKAMLVGKEHQNKIDDTILTLQTESKQLKQLLGTKDSEMQHMQNVVLEKENELSNMELIREECKHLKQMLVVNGRHPQGPSLSSEHAELEAKNAEIIELRNSTSDMELLQEECKQLKQMLLNNTQPVPDPPSHDASSDVSCQLLEAMLEDRDVQIAEQNAVITELQNKTTDMNSIQEECQQLKNMLAEKGKQDTGLMESPSVASHAMNSTTDYFENSFVQQVQQLEEFLKEKEEGLKIKEKEVEILTGKLEEKENAISDFDLIQNECKMLKEMLKEKEEFFIEVQNDLDNANSVIQQRNNDIKAKESSYMELQNRLEATLNYKDMELLRLQEEMSDSVAQDENMHMLQTEYRNVEENLKATQNELCDVSQLLDKSENEYNAVKQSLSETENECERLRMFAEQHAELSLSVTLRDEELSTLTTEVENLQNEKTTLLLLCADKESNVKIAEDSVLNLQNELQEKIKVADEMKQHNEIFKETIDKNTSIISDQVTHIRQLTGQLEQSEAEKGSLGNIVNEHKINLKEQEDEICKLQTTVDDSVKEINDKTDKLCQIESELMRSKDYQEQLVESIKLYQHKDEESTVCKNCEYLDSERKMMNTILANIEKMLQLSGQQLYIQDRTHSIIEHLSSIEASLQNLLKKIDDKEIEIYDLNSSKNEMKLNYEQTVSEQMSMISALEKRSEESMSLNLTQKSTYDLQIQDLQSQLVENSEVETLYQNKCLEYNDLQEQFLQEQKKYKEQIASIENAANSKINAELEHLRNELERHSHTYLNKNKECDGLKLEMLQLEETVFNLKLNLETMKGFEETAKSIPNLQQMINNKDGEINQLKSILEDNKFKIESSKKDKQFLDELVKAKVHLEKEKEELLFQNEQRDRLIQEKVISLTGLEEMAKLLPNLQQSINEKDKEINQLKSILEDNELKIEGSKKEKQFLDDFLKSKEHLEKEKEELVFQNEQRNRLIQEKDISLRHKDVTIREMEVKTKRELERLRNHMIMTEEAHTKDIVELQEKEEALQHELDDAKQGLSKKSIILQDSSKQFQEHCIDLEEQLHSLSAQRDAGVLELARCHDKIATDAAAVYNLQNALEQLQKEKYEQSDYLTSFVKRKEIEYESRIEELVEELNKTQGAMAEAALAVQGINKLNLELQQKENELKVSKEKMNELLAHLHQMQAERDKILEAADHKLDKSLLRNLFMKYFQSPNDKRSDILHVIGGLLGWTPDEIQEIGSGAAPSKVGGWITSVWSYGSPKKTPTTPVKTPPVYDSNKSLSELFVNFLENETSRDIPVDTTSLTLSNDIAPNLQMFVSPTTPDILAFHNSSPDQRIPAPGQEIPRVHTHHAQSTLKSILTSGPY